MWSRQKRPIQPTYATVPEAIRFLASTCDGAIRRDGYGFATEHVDYGHWIAKLPDQCWQGQETQSGLQLVRIYRGQLSRAGFKPDQILKGAHPRKMRRRQAKQVHPLWAPDPTGLHGMRWWNGARWTEWTLDQPADHT